MSATKFDKHDVGEANLVLGMKTYRDKATHKLWID